MVYTFGAHVPTIMVYTFGAHVPSIMVYTFGAQVPTIMVNPKPLNPEPKLEPLGFTRSSAAAGEVHLLGWSPRVFERVRRV